MFANKDVIYHEGSSHDLLRSLMDDHSKRALYERSVQPSTETNPLPKSQLGKKIEKLSTFSKFIK